MRSVVFFKKMRGVEWGRSPPRGGVGGGRSPPHCVSNDQKKKFPFAPLKLPLLASFEPSFKPSFQFRGSWKP